MKPITNLLLITAISFVFISCKKDDAPNSDVVGGKFTMKTAAGINYSTNVIKTANLVTRSGEFYFKADPFSNYRKFYAFIGSFDDKNEILLNINLNGTNQISETAPSTGAGLLTTVTINGTFSFVYRQIVSFTSNSYPGKIVGTYTLYDKNNKSLCSGTFDYTAK